MSNKVNWAEVDKRIRDRRVSWTADERKALDKDLMSLPDVADKAEQVDIPQPAFVQQEAEGEQAVDADARPEGHAASE